MIQYELEPGQTLPGLIVYVSQMCEWTAGGAGACEQCCRGVVPTRSLVHTYVPLINHRDRRGFRLAAYGELYREEWLREDALEREAMQRQLAGDWSECAAWPRLCLPCAGAAFGSTHPLMEDAVINPRLQTLRVHVVDFRHGDENDEWSAAPSDSSVPLTTALEKIVDQVTKSVLEADRAEWKAAVDRMFRYDIPAWSIASTIELGKQSESGPADE